MDAIQRHRFRTELGFGLELSDAEEEYRTINTGT